ncbi:unnamed protein product [Rangifer tarandus platyrhynchus]|uniref:Uncharacterized protein n=1 Tax=Rangifer tarandus platyrhynchus TaxID=3082113 RepID=A0AC59ZE93_RANTA
MGGGGEERGDGGGGGDSARGAESETEVTEAGLWKAGLGIQRAGRGRSVPPTPDAQPAFSAPTYPRERPAGDILTPTPPSPPRGERSFTTTHRRPPWGGAEPGDLWGVAGPPRKRAE